MMLFLHCSPFLFVIGYHGVGGPITVERPRYISEIKQPIFEAIKAMGYQIVDPNSRQQTGKPVLFIPVFNIPLFACFF